jgi:ribonuclease T1
MNLTGFIQFLRTILRAALLCVVAALCQAAAPFTAAQTASDAGAVAVQDLPPEARDVIARIRTNGPFAFKRDGVTFGNFEKRLPIRPRGYYREYTVPTPGEHTRGARRIIAGRDGEFFYTADHYETFRRIIQ